MLAIKSHPNKLLVRNYVKLSSTENPTLFPMKLRSLGQKKKKTIRNQWKIEVKMGKPVDMDLFFLLFDFSTPRRSRHPQDGSQDGSKRAPRPPSSSQDPSKTVQDAFKTAQDETKTLQEAFKSRQDRQNDPQKASKTEFWRILGANMEACWHQNRIKINFLSKKAKSSVVLEILLFFQWN